MKKQWWVFISLLGSVFSGAGAYASIENETCQTVTMTDPGWTDIAATNGVLNTLLEGMGYKSDTMLLSVPVGFKSLTTGQIDVFLGNWMPAQSHLIDKYGKDIDIIRTNLEGVKFTLAVPHYVYEQGVTSFADLNKFADKFHSRIYGIAAGAPANSKLQSMIDKNDFQLKDWKLVESSEQGMLAQVSRAIRQKKFIVFLGWEPHPMNVKFDIDYLSGGDEYFGANYGAATIRTLTRKGYSQECPNVGQLLSNLSFGLDMENELIDLATDDAVTPVDAAKKWLKMHPDVLETWLTNVSTYSGEPALPAVKANLGL